MSIKNFDLMWFRLTLTCHAICNRKKIVLCYLCWRAAMVCVRAFPANACCFLGFECTMYLLNTAAPALWSCTEPKTRAGRSIRGPAHVRSVDLYCTYITLFGTKTMYKTLVILIKWEDYKCVLLNLLLL